MSTLLISYDLMSPETRKDYKELIDCIKSFPWAKPLYSVWFIKTDKSCSEVRDELKLRVDSNDKILVIDVTGKPWATYNFPKEVLDWMHSNL